MRRAIQSGYTLIELVIGAGIAALLLVALQQMLSTGMSAAALGKERTELARNARFAMERMVDAVNSGEYLLIPMADNPGTGLDENVREQTVPASSPPTGSTLATAVLAVTLSHTQDMDTDGIFDADNDNDGQFDEDLPADIHNDGKAGVRDFDDDGNGVKDFFLSPSGDDDESSMLTQSEDPINGMDDDGDGSIDEDPSADNNGDGCPGICGVDDDGDGFFDEGGSDEDDDEDGQSNEDWLDPVVFYLASSSLLERRAVPWDTNGNGSVNGQDYVESTIADNVTLLRFERLPWNGSGQLVDITLTLTGPSGETISLNTQVRLGGNL